MGRITRRGVDGCVDAVQWAVDGFNSTCVLMGWEQAIGLSFTIEAGTISLVFILLLIVLVVRNRLRYKRMYPTQRLRMLQRPIDAYMIGLFSLDSFQALGMVLDIRWVREGKTFIGRYCTAQGALGQFGEAGSAMMTLVITLHTCFVICRFMPSWNRSLPIACGIVGLIFVFLILFVTLSIGLHAPNEYMAPTPSWCWIGSRYIGQKVAGEYAWIWLNFLSSVMVYVPLFLWKHGNLTFEDGLWNKVRLHWTPPAPFRGEPLRTSLSLLAYPVASTVLFLPLTIIRWMTFVTSSSERDHPYIVPTAWNFVAVILFGLTGAANVLLLLFTRPGVLLFTPPDEHLITVRTHRTDINGGRAPSIKHRSAADLSIDEGRDIAMTPSDEPGAYFDDHETGSAYAIQGGNFRVVVTPPSLHGLSNNQ